MNVDKKSEKFGWVIETELSWEEILVRTALVVADFKDLMRRLEMETPVYVEEENSHGVQINLVNFGGLWTMASFFVLYVEEDGKRLVSVHLISVSTERLVVAGFIPVTPSISFGVSDYKVFSARLRRAIRAQQRPQKKTALRRPVEPLIPAPSQSTPPPVSEVAPAQGSSPASPTSNSDSSSSTALNQSPVAHTVSLPAQEIPAQEVPAQTPPVQEVPLQAPPVQAMPIQELPQESVAGLPTADYYAAPQAYHPEESAVAQPFAQAMPYQPAPQVNYAETPVTYPTDYYTQSPSMYAAAAYFPSQSEPGVQPVPEAMNYYQDPNASEGYLPPSANPQ